MPSLSSSAVSSATSVQKAMELVNTEIKYGLMKMFGDLMGETDNTFNGPEGIAVSGSKAVAKLVYAFRKATNEITTLIKRWWAGH